MVHHINTFFDNMSLEERNSYKMASAKDWWKSLTFMHKCTYALEYLGSKTFNDIDVTTISDQYILFIYEQYHC